MELSSRPAVSYAGMEAGLLLEEAKRCFALTEEAIPQRFADFLPLFPSELIVTMEYRGGGRFSIEPAEYHQKLRERMPQLYAGDNAQRAFDAQGRFRRGAVVTVDPLWAEHFPQYEPFLGEKLMLYAIGGGCQAAAVPFSVFPCGGGVLERAERGLGIWQRCAHYAGWLAGRLDEGQPFEGAEEAYLEAHGLSACCIRQSDIARAMREVQVMRALQQGGEAAPQPASEAAARQYVPYRYACDVFEPEAATRRTSRLVQLYFSGERVPGDFWIPYEEAAAYLHKKRGTLDVRALCEAFQIAPVFDADPRGGCYPDCVRLVAVRDRGLEMQTAAVSNNPAYGSGLGPQGAPRHLVFLPGSADLLRHKRLSEEPLPVTLIHTRAEEAACLRMRALAEKQEYKGRLIDALLRREEVLTQLQAGSIAFRKAKELLDGRIDPLWKRIQSAPDDACPSGYDADIAYLQHMAQHREAKQEAPFEPDALREASIAAGRAARASVRSFALSALCEKPDQPERPRTPAPAPGRETASDGLRFEQMNMFAAPAAETKKEENPHEPDAP